ncbi:MAG: hypothetical protein AAFV19_01560 [Pseudomonadota bacterium]
MLMNLTVSEPRSDVDILTFACALILAPLATAAALFFLIVPLFAVPIGALPYLLFGGPAYWFTLRRLPDAKGCIGPLVRAGLFANLGTVPLLLLLAFADGYVPRVGEIASFLALGFLFAGLWSLVFGWIYRTFAKKHMPHVATEIFD